MNTNCQEVPFNVYSVEPIFNFNAVTRYGELYIVIDNDQTAELPYCVSGVQITVNIHLDKSYSHLTDSVGSGEVLIPHSIKYGLLLSLLSNGTITLPSEYTFTKKTFNLTDGRTRTEVVILNSSGDVVNPCWLAFTDALSQKEVYEQDLPINNDHLFEDDRIEKRLLEIKHPSDLTLFEFSLLAADYINSYPIPENIQQIVENALPNVFLDQSKISPLPLASHPYDAGSMYQLFRTPKFDNIACIMEDTVSQPFNSFHFYFNSNVKNQYRFGGIDSSSTGSSHRTKVIVNSNVSGYMVPRAKEGTGYVTNNVNNGGIHIYTADNLFMTVDRELHAAVNTDGYLKVGQNLNVLVGARKSKPAVAVIPRTFYEESVNFKLPETETNIEIQNNLNILSHDNELTKITATSPFHLRVTREKYLSNRDFSGKENIELFKNVDDLDDRVDEQDLKNLYITVSDNIHLISGGILRMSVARGITSSISLPIDVNGNFTLRTYDKKNINLETHNGGNIGLSTVHGGDIVLNAPFQGGILFKTHDGDILSNTEYKGSIYNIVECDGDIEMLVNNVGFVNIKTYEGEINVESRYKGNVNVKTRTGDINLETSLLGDINAETHNGNMNLYTFRDKNLTDVNTDINIVSHDGNINIFARNDEKCPSINIKSQNAIILDAPVVYIRQGDLVVDGQIQCVSMASKELIYIKGCPMGPGEPCC